jgi:hypothetical protein
MSPAETYRRRLEERAAVVRRHEQQHIRLGNIRLMMGLAAAAIAWMAFAERTIAPVWLLVPVLAFVPLAVWHEAIVRRQTKAQRAVQFYERGLARIEDRWVGTGEPGEGFRDSAHPYADDLDLFGRGSLFELLNAARTFGGEARLAGWLRGDDAPDAAAIGRRQKAVGELRERLDLREDLFVLGEEARDKLRSDALVAWAEQPQVMGGLRWLALAITALVVAGAIGAKMTGHITVLLLPVMAAAGFGYGMRPRVLAVIAHLNDAVHEIDLLRGMLERLEREPLGEPLFAGAPPSVEIARLHRLAELVDSRDNAVVRLIGPPLLYSTHLAFAVERWRAASGGRVRQWIETVNRMEALLSLAGYSFEHPEDPFPEFHEAARVEGEGLGHPLLEAARCVRNAVELGGGRQLLLVSGSNMSGKSTYLRTVGINVVLAMAGAPVRARSLRLCPLRIGASIRVTDSLQGGSSRFYAEITRLKQIVDLTRGGGAALFLLDEFLHGTNSHDRRIGAEGVLRGLVARGAMGIVTTHDLALTEVVAALEGRSENAHFEDHLEDGELRFDYTLRAGVVRKSNALELMRSIGLDVGGGG